MALDENEVWFLNGMEQGLLRYLPDVYREVAYRLVEYLGSEIDLRKEFWRKNGKG